jgi:hypothetical protein
MTTPVVIGSTINQSTKIVIGPRRFLRRLSIPQSYRRTGGGRAERGLGEDERPHKLRGFSLSDDLSNKQRGTTKTTKDTK